MNADRDRLDRAREARRKQAPAYFATHAADWDQIRALHAPTSGSKRAIRDAIGATAVPHSARSRHRHRPHAGTVRPASERAPRRRPVARHAGAGARPHRSGRPEAIALRQGDIYALAGAERNAFDLVVIHQVLHFLDDPARARSARPRGRWRRAGGCWWSISTPTTRNSCARSSHIAGSASRSTRSRAMLAEAGLTSIRMERVPPGQGEAGKLTVVALDRRGSARHLR